MTLNTIVQFLDSVLPIEDVARIDYSLNGLQVGRSDLQVKKAAFAVDACMAAFTRAAEEGADLLCVHHGLFWGKPLAVTGEHYRRIKFLLDHDLALYAAHLPLDMHMEVGNNAGLADALELHNREPFGMYHGIKIGIKGELNEALDIDTVLKKIGLNRDTALGVLEFGRREIKSVGVISGGADKEVSQAILEGLDLYITGELSHQVYHTCLESGINLVAGGHYHTETYGVRKLMQVLKDECDIETVFIDVPTGL